MGQADDGKTTASMSTATAARPTSSHEATDGTEPDPASPTVSLRGFPHQRCVLPDARTLLGRPGARGPGRGGSGACRSAAGDRPRHRVLGRSADDRFLDSRPEARSKSDACREYRGPARLPRHEAFVDFDDLSLQLRERPPDLHLALPRRKDVVAGQVHSQVLGIVAGQFRQALFGQPVDDCADPRPAGPARAHAARLNRGVERTLRQKPLPVVKVLPEAIRVFPSGPTSVEPKGWLPLSRLAREMAMVSRSHSISVRNSVLLR